jgi:protein SCO1/2
MQRVVLTSTLVALLGVVELHAATDGFRALTAEGARRLRVLRDPRPVPDVALEDQLGHPFHLDDYRGRMVAVEFVYTRCETLCRSLGTAFQQIKSRIPPDRLGRDLALLSVSFDMEHDQVEDLASYAQVYGADATGWRVAIPRSRADLERLLAAFGVVVIPDGRGGYEHNAAIHLLDRSGRLVSIDGLDEVDELISRLGLPP